jgi:hypothetical protein
VSTERRSTDDGIAAREEDGMWSGRARVTRFLPRNVVTSYLTIGNYCRIVRPATERGQRTHPAHAPASVGTGAR